MAYSIKSMLYLSELYFTNGEGSYRFQWTNQAFVDKNTHPGSPEDDEEYYQQLAKYNYLYKHLNDGSDNAVKYRINIYDMESEERVFSYVVTENSIDVDLDAGEYLWEVEALDKNENQITISEKFYVNTKYSYWENDMETSHRDSSAEFQIGYVGDQLNYGTFPDYECRAACAGRISGDGHDSNFLVCGPAHCGNESAWEFSQDGGFSFSTANAFGGFDGEFELCGNILITCSGIYEYEDGNWNYKIFTAPWLTGSEYRGNENYFFVDDEKTIYKWDAVQDTICKVVTAAKEIYYISDFYYVTQDGVFSIEDNSQVIKYDVSFGENPVYNDMFFNIYAKTSSGKKADYISKGKSAEVEVKYFFFDKSNDQIIEKEITLFSGVAPFAIDAEEILKTRIGNCICFVMSDENDDMETSTQYIYIHEINKDGSITEHLFECNTWDDVLFDVNAGGKLTTTYTNVSNEREITKTWNNIQVNFDDLWPSSRFNAGDKNGISLTKITGENHITEYAIDSNFSAVLQLKTTGDTEIDTLGLPNGSYSLRISGDNGNTWHNCHNIDSNNSTAARFLKSDEDQNLDVFFANANGKWTSGYAAQHTGILNSWSGTDEQVTLTGKNKLADIFEGSNDANILVMTDDSNGDALFVDDIYTALPGTVAKQQARIAQIDEIRAGAGDDIVDMTSQRFAYVGDGVTIYGGLGNDTIWANNGNNTLFGDAGNDRIVGGSDDDVIVGGIGNDRMHGGGGEDIFCFGKNWGKDTVEQLADGEIMLWFESGVMSNWNASTMTYTDGANSVKVSGVSADNITLIFGDDNSLLYDELANSGCFDDAASEKIFEDKNKGMLA